MIPPIRRWSAPIECATPPCPAAPMPRTRARRPDPDTTDPHPPHTRPPAPSHRPRPTPGSLRRERLNDAIPRTRRSRCTPDSYAPATFFPHCRRPRTAPGQRRRDRWPGDHLHAARLRPQTATADSPEAPPLPAAIDRARSAAEGRSVLVVEDLDLDHPVHHGQDRQ